MDSLVTILGLVWAVIVLALGAILLVKIALVRAIFLPPHPQLHRRVLL